MRHISSEAVSYAMMLILLLLTVVFWNGVKRIDFLGGLSKIILTFCVSMLGLIGIGELMVVPLDVTGCDSKQGDFQDSCLTQTQPMLVNLYAKAIPSLMAAFWILLNLGMIVFCGQSHEEAIEDFFRPKAKSSDP